MLNAFFALLAGVVTIAAPCTLPVLPILLGSSLGRASTTRPAFIALGFVTSFTAAALLLSALTRTFHFDPAHLRDAAIVLLIGFGALMIWPAPFERMTAALNGIAGRTAPSDRAGNLGGFVLGTTLGLVWTPCAGPVLGSILTLIATSPDKNEASLLLLVYAVGAALPMLAIAYGGQAVTARVRSLARITPRLQQGFGVAVIAFAVAMFFQYDALAVAWLTQFYPNGQTGL